MTKSDTVVQDRLPSFEGREVKTQRLKFTGSVDKDEYIADHNEGDDVVFVVCKMRVDNVGHKFVEDGVIRVEAVKVIDAVVDKSGAAEKLYQEAAAAEIDLRRERSGVASLDDALDESDASKAAAAAKAALDSSDADDSGTGEGGTEGGGDEVAAARAARAGGAKKTTGDKPKPPAKKSTARKATGADKRSRRSST